MPSNGPSRSLVLVGILAGHAVLIYFMATSRPHDRTDRVEEFRSMPIYLAPLFEEPPPVRKIPSPSIRSRPLPAESTAITITAQLQGPAPEDTPTPAVDWTKEATAAIQNMARPASGPVTFGAQPPAETPPKAPPGIFEKQSPREAGFTEELGPGITRRWLSDKCYMEFGHLPELFPAPGPRFNPVRCIIGSSEVEGRLFDHLKPEYLKRK